MLRAVLRGLRRAVTALGLGLGAFLAAAALGGLIPGRAADLPAGDTVEIALLYGPIHVDFLLPATDETRAAFGFAAGAGVPVGHPDVRHLMVGWGAREFYTTAGTFADITAAATLRAVTGDASVLRIEVIGEFPPGFDPPRLRLSRDQYAALLSAIAATADGPPIPTAGFTPTDGFVTAAGRFHLFRTCNTWVSDMLRAAGIPAGAWTPTPYAVRLGLWRAGLPG
ncbi:DUF2459 domain-containing protein [Roseicyclus persicicus]|uniref:DUF2459 domain-containing protein n=1 Tax=Roseicyclus persicicus TaxID=2650661 RepID=A0A7X6H3T3_9RHOB|nr:DUF2459 domain-containing protein [Roseibacterium persicicum]NKX46346.1 DUF2459 domain-containing protein [Roseibacterium persicicum]